MKTLILFISCFLLITSSQAEEHYQTLEGLGGGAGAKTTIGDPILLVDALHTNFNFRPVNEDQILDVVCPYGYVLHIKETYDPRGVYGLTPKRTGAEIKCVKEQ